jgi:tetratricopeptide (TPR) repeat protein
MEPMQGHGVEPAAEGVDPAPAGGAEPVPDDVKPRRAAVPEGMKRPHAGGVKTVLGIGVELVDVATGWQIWGESFDCESNDLLQIQDSITRQLLVNLKLKLTGEEEKRVTARYTENARAYQAYLEGRYHWSRYTRKGIETAIKNFRRAIELDSNYALAYAAIVDCYLRLATNYLPPEAAHLPLKAQRRNFNVAKGGECSGVNEAYTKIKLRFEWDWKGAERELRRANELKTVYPAAHQWYAAYRSAQLLFAASNKFKGKKGPSIAADRTYPAVPDQVARLQLTPNEHVQICCAIARDQIDVGNYAAASEILKSRWVFGDWPKLDGLTQQSCADLLFTAGELAGCVASTRQLRGGQKHGEALLNGSIAIFEQLGSERLASEGRIELALCYYRQGLFDLGRSILRRVIDTLSLNDIDLQSLALIRLASLERHAGRLKEALSYLKHAESLAGTAGPWTSGRCYLELASTYKDLAISEETTRYSENGREYYRRALHEFEAVGNHRLCAIVENNLGVLLLIVGHSGDAEGHLLRARAIFNHFDDRIRRAQVDESLAQLYLAQRKLSNAQIAIEQSVQTMELGDEDACLAESLTTKGLIYCELQRYNEAQKALDGAYRLASRCGDIEGAGKAIVILVEKLSGVLAREERSRIRAILLELLSSSQHDSIKSRAAKCLKIMDSLTDPNNP